MQKKKKKLNRRKNERIRNTMKELFYLEAKRGKRDQRGAVKSNFDKFKSNLNDRLQFCSKTKGRGGRVKKKEGWFYLSREDYGVRKRKVLRRLLTDRYWFPVKSTGTVTEATSGSDNFHWNICANLFLVNINDNIYIKLTIDDTRINQQLRIIGNFRNLYTIPEVLILRFFLTISDFLQNYIINYIIPIFQLKINSIDNGLINNFSAEFFSRYERHLIETIKTSSDRMEPEWKRKKKAKAYRKISCFMDQTAPLAKIYSWRNSTPRMVWQISKIRKSLLYP